MDKELERLRGKLREIEAEIENKFDAHNAELLYRIESNKAVFEQEIIDRHRQLKIGLLRFLRQSPLLSIVIAPVIYGLVIPLALLDLALIGYQRICFPVWGIGRVRRSDYVVIDRHRLAYLNGIQKLNCVYCGYANGLLALAREVAGRTEQYWCPIRHARSAKGAHGRYDRFLPYGDAEGFRDRLEGLREEVRRL